MSSENKPKAQFEVSAKAHPDKKKYNNSYASKRDNKCNLKGERKWELRHLTHTHLQEEL